MDIFLIRNNEKLINVKTGSKKLIIDETNNDTVKIILKSQSSDELANKELIETLSDLLNVQKSKIQIYKDII